MDERLELLRRMYLLSDSGIDRRKFLRACIRAGRSIDMSLLEPGDILTLDELPKKWHPQWYFDFYGACEHAIVVYELVVRSQRSGKWAAIAQSEALHLDSQWRVPELEQAGGVDMHEDGAYSLSDRTKQILAARYLRE